VAEASPEALKKTLSKGLLAKRVATISDFNSTGRLGRLESVTKGMSPQYILTLERPQRTPALQAMGLLINAIQTSPRLNLPERTFKVYVF